MGQMDLQKHLLTRLTRQPGEGAGLLYPVVQGCRTLEKSACAMFALSQATQGDEARRLKGLADALHTAATIYAQHGWYTQMAANARDMVVTMARTQDAYCAGFREGCAAVIRVCELELLN
jgi:hypothetical protein